MTASGQMPTYLGMPSFPAAARTAVADSQLRANLMLMALIWVIVAIINVAYAPRKHPHQ